MEMLMTELCQELRNWFDRDQPKLKRKFQISHGRIEVPELQNSQYFRIVGSVFNDGVHRYGDVLIDEEFDGTIWAMAVPPTVIALAEEIGAWQAKYGGADSAAMSPYNSESFGGYSYSKSGGGGGSGGSVGSGADWKSVFAGRLNRWRKIL